MSKRRSYNLPTFPMILPDTTIAMVTILSRPLDQLNQLVGSQCWVLGCSPSTKIGLNILPMTGVYSLLATLSPLQVPCVYQTIQGAHRDMDLREYRLSSAQIDRGATVLNYQPFILSDDVQTGVAYSWLYADDPRVSPPFVFRRSEWGQQWSKITMANAQLREMYDNFIEEIAIRYPGGRLFDVACNNGYFPVRASQLGMKDCVGSDLGAHYAESFQFLNEVLGTSAQFCHAPYDPASGRLTTEERYDVVVAVAIMCHLPNPLRFLSALGAIANEAIFFWGQMLDTEDFVASYNPPHPNLSAKQVFPYCFNDNTRISKGLFREAARQMGFHNVLILPPKPRWLFAEAAGNGDLTSEIRSGSPHMAVLAMR